MLSDDYFSVNFHNTVFLFFFFFVEMSIILDLL